MNEETRERIRETGISVWLRADLDVLMRRVRKRANRPLLRNPDPEQEEKALQEKLSASAAAPASIRPARKRMEPP